MDDKLRNAFSKCYGRHSELIHNFYNENSDLTINEGEVLAPVKLVTSPPPSNNLLLTVQGGTSVVVVLQCDVLLCPCVYGLLE